VEKRIVVETAVVKLARMEDLRPLSEIAASLKAAGEFPAARRESQPSAQARPARKTAEPRRPDIAPPVESERPPDEPPVSSAPEPSDVPVVSASGPLGEIQALWPRLIALVKVRHQPSLAAILRDVQVAALNDDRLTLAVPAGYGFHRRQLSEPESVGLIEDCLAEVAGRRLKIKLAAGSEPDGTAEAHPKPSESKSDGAKPAHHKAQDNPAVHKAVELFGGRVMEEES
jgi:hypothetical protein